MRRFDSRDPNIVRESSARRIGQSGSCLEPASLANQLRTISSSLPVRRYPRAEMSPANRALRCYLRSGAMVISAPGESGGISDVSRARFLQRRNDLRQSRWHRPRCSTARYRRLDLKLNSVGTPADRAAFNDALRKALEPVVGRCATNCKRRAVTNPLRVFDCKVPADHHHRRPCAHQQISRRGFPARTSPRCRISLPSGVPFTLDDRLVRDSTTTPHRLRIHPRRAGSAKCDPGGGRYDGLSEALGAPPPRASGSPSAKTPG